MSNTPRCHDCDHKRGPRSTANLAKVQPNEQPRPKKAPCGCACHAARALARIGGE